jgi:hypothetical protein
MKGKIAFVIGAAVGYVLGTRAGRERYAQIKRGAQQVWDTEPVQRGVGAVKGAAQHKVDEIKASMVRAAKDAYANLARASAQQPAGPTATAPAPATAPAQNQDEKLGSAS